MYMYTHVSLKLIALYLYNTFLSVKSSTHLTLLMLNRGFLMLSIPTFNLLLLITPISHF